MCVNGCSCGKGDHLILFLCPGVENHLTEAHLPTLESPSICDEAIRAGCSVLLPIYSGLFIGVLENLL